jgi:uncharacterized protein YbjT (DUF2867 family)
MHVIMGGTGRVGSATALSLLRRGQPVAILTRNPPAAGHWRARGAEVLFADAEDVSSLRDAFRSGRRALLVNPLADPAGDTDAAENRTVDTILTALEGSGLEKVVAVSTYGAQPGERIGDLGTLWRLEDGLAHQDIPVAVNRGAYYLSNWDGSVTSVRESGVLPSMLPADLVLPMVAPVDVGDAAADRLVSSVDDVGIEYVEGPRRHSPADVAAVLAAELGGPVKVQVTPLASLEDSFAAMGFSAAAAASYAGMTSRTVQRLELPESPRRGATSLQQYVSELLNG